MHLNELKSQFVCEHYRGVSPSTSAFLDACVGSYSTYLHHRATIADLNRVSVNCYIDWMFCNRAYDTMRTQRSGLLMLWRYAADRGLIDQPGRVRLPKRKQPIVQAWTVEEVSRLRDHCLQLNGTLSNGISRAAFFGSLVASSYETGFRLSDQLSIEYEWIANGRLTLIENKTGKASRRQLTAQTMRLIEICFAEQPSRRLVWPMWARREAFFQQFKLIVKSSGIRSGTFKWIRRAAATAAEKTQAGLGTEFLQHSSPRVTRDSYIDQSQIIQSPIQVPGLLPITG